MSNKKGIVAVALLVCLCGTAKVQAAEQGKGAFSSGNSYYKTSADTTVANEFSSYAKAAAPRIQYSEYIRNNYKVKDQGTLGTCWAFSLTSAAEINLHKKGLTNEFLDLSESHLAYFFFHRMEDKWGRTKGDSVSYIGTDTSGYLNLGNNLDYAIKALANGVGYASEEDGRYEQIQSSYATYSALSKKQKIATQMKDSVRLSNVEMVNPTNRTLVKRKLAEYGAAAVSFYSGYGVYSDKNSCYYSDIDYGTDHAVTLVGYDDSYSKKNFSVRPKNDGAWLVLNSWGTEFGQKGYAWISYEDASLSDFAFLDVSLANADETIYQYDGSSYNGDYYEEKKNAGTANVYTSGSAPEVLNEVSFYTLVDDSKVKVEVYSGYRSGNSKGTLVASKTTDVTSAGYHTMSLPNPIYLEPNTKFAVVVTYLGSGNWIPIDISCVELESYKSGIKFTAVCNQGESYSIDTNGTWTESKYNFRIKAFTRKAETNEKTTIRYYNGNQVVRQASVYKNGARYVLKPYSTTGYTLEGWYLDSQFKKKVSMVDLTSETINVYAKMNVVIGPVSNLRAAGQSGTKVRLDWSKASNAKEYEIYQYNPKKKTFVLVATTKNTSITIRNLSKNTTYRFKIRGKNGSVYGPMTKESQATTTITKPALKVLKKGSNTTLSISKNSNVTFAELYVKKGSGKYRLQKTIKVKNGKAVTTKLPIKKNQKYKVKVRTYTVLNGKKQYSAFSKEITVTKASYLTVQGK